MPSTTPRCAYEFISGENCPEPVYGNFSHCILHIELPEKRTSEYETIVKAKKARAQEKIDAGDFDFDGAKLVEFSVSRLELKNANFFRATFSGYADFFGATFSGYAVFDSARFNCDAYLHAATFSASAAFDRATFAGAAWFYGTTFSSYALFLGATFYGAATFINATFDCDAYFYEARFLTAGFSGATFRGDAYFYGATFAEELWAFNTRFDIPSAQEAFYRIAKRNWEGRGDKDLADKYHFREMEAKRKQKQQPIRVLEKLAIQYPLGYGTRPANLALTWISAAIISGIVLAYFSGQQENVAVGIAALFAPGFGLSHAQSGVVMWIGAVEAALAAFFWAAFIAVFSRKYMH